MALLIFQQNDFVMFYLFFSIIIYSQCHRLNGSVLMKFREPTMVYRMSLIDWFSFNEIWSAHNGLHKEEGVLP